MIDYRIDDKGIVTLTLNNPDKSANVINEKFGEALRHTIARLQNEKDKVRGIIITSAKETFMAGADIDELFAESSAKVFYDRSMEFKAALRYLETQGKPVVAAINGTALGGGFEITLACHRRICLDNDKIQLGLPEVTLGLLPGGGGVTRMVRLLGLQPAFTYLTEGKKVSPKEALADGLIHELAGNREELLHKAEAWILSNATARQPWDADGYKIPGGAPNTPKVAQMLPVAPAMLAKKTYNNYPAPLAILSAAVEGALVDFETASRIESRYFAQLATGNVAKNMIKAFWHQLNTINSGKSRPDVKVNGEFKKVGILGAGMMGSAIAYCVAMSGITCILKDVSDEAAAKGKSYSENILKKRVSRGKMTQQKADEVLQRIYPTSRPEDLAGCDLVIEAVFENRELKAKVTRETEAVMDPNGIFASNTSTLPITGLASASSRPQNFIGLHFFSPADKMPLVEIIVGKQTSDETLARSFDFVKTIRKTPIVVNDSRGFYTSRVFATYVLEGLALLHEGNNPRSIESAGLQAGMPVGPLALTDEVSLGLLAHIRKQTIEDLQAEGKEIPQHTAYEVVEKMIAAGRLGKAKGAGFYEYPQNGKKHLWSGLREMFGIKRAVAAGGSAASAQATYSDDLPLQEMKDRLMFIQCIETVRCLEEGVLRSVPDANIGSIFGWGFAPFKGGTLQFINDYGLPQFIARANELRARYGERFAVPDLLTRMARDGKTFE
ncbi:MAG: 3-hydroxyacyl-CoA dehydrogenase NAD-binding domain-containing protein [Chitinophagales bacterium]|nr:3-hydroxyacyl-CoA dehydrogenase NAD-binding domain-containing protein [Chitinophagales bacterium]MDW8418048.1 3-hydroxyacyl-CoA dehydrogenase NAD-binding domain-containing protein [Chitinophagales bacterium]